MGKAIIKFDINEINKGLNISLLNSILNKLPENTKIVGFFNPYNSGGNNSDYIIHVENDLFKKVPEGEFLPAITFVKKILNNYEFCENVDMSAALKAYDTVTNVNTTNKLVTISNPNQDEPFYKLDKYIDFKLPSALLSDSAIYGTGQLTEVWDVVNSSTGYTYIPTATGTMAYPPNTVGPTATVVAKEIDPGIFEVTLPNGITSTSNFDMMVDFLNKSGYTYKFYYITSFNENKICQHDFKEYIGLTQRYNYCVKCDQKA